MPSQLKMGAILSYVNIIVTMLVGLVYTPIMLRLLGQNEFGLYSLIGAMMAYLSVLDMGLSNTVVRYVAKNRIEGNKENEAELSGLFLFIYSIIGFLTVMIGSVLYFNLENMFGNTLDIEQLYKTKIMVILLTFNFAFTFPLSIFASLMQAYEKFIFLRIINILRVALNPLLALPFLFMGFSSVSLVIITTALNLFCLLSNVFYCFKYLDIHFKRGKFEKEFLYEVAGYSFFIFLNVIMDKIYWGSGQFILGMVSGTAQVAVYAIVMQFTNMYMQFSTAISGVILPRVTMMVAKGVNRNELTELMIKVGRLQYIIIGYIVIMFFLLGKDFIFLWAGENYLPSYPMILLLMLVMTIPLIQNTGIAILQAMNLNKFRMTAYTIFAVINIFMSFILAKKYGGLGCAVSSACAIFISTGLIMNWYYVKKIHLNMTLFWKNILQMLPSGILLICIVSILDIFLPVETNWINLFTCIIIYSFIYFLSIYFFSFNNYEKSIIQNLIRRFI